MRALSLIEFVTLDGVMQSFGSPDEDRDGGFEHGGWGASYADRSMFEASAASLQDDTAYLFGRRTYQKTQVGWSNQPDENPMAAHLNRQPKYVATRTLTEASWNNTRILDGDLVPAVRKLKDGGDGTIVVLGTGKRLFRAYDRPRGLRLESCTPSRTGVMVCTYSAG
jgi:dihydrofolate reductase